MLKEIYKLYYNLTGCLCVTDGRDSISNFLTQTYESWHWPSNVGPENRITYPQSRVTMKIKTHRASNKWNARFKRRCNRRWHDEQTSKWLERLNVKLLTRWCCYCRFVCNQKLFMHGCTTWWNNAQQLPPSSQNRKANKKTKTLNGNLMYCFHTWVEFQISTPSKTIDTQWYSAV